MAIESVLYDRKSVADTSKDRADRDRSDRLRGAIISDLQLQIQEISSRISEVDIEKAERNQLRNDLKNLEHQLQVNMELMSTRLKQCEMRFNGSATSKSQLEDESDLPAFRERLNRLEDRLEKLDLVSKRINGLEENGRVGSEQLSWLQDQYSMLRKEVVEIKFHVEQLSRTQEEVEPHSPLKEDIQAIRKYLDELHRIIDKPASR